MCWKLVQWRLQFLLAVVCVVLCPADLQLERSDDDAVSLLQESVRFKTVKLNSTTQKNPTVLNVQAKDETVRSISSYFSPAKLEALLQSSVAKISFSSSNQTLVDAKDRKKPAEDIEEPHYVFMISAIVYSTMGILWLVWYYQSESNRNPYLYTTLMASTWVTISVGMNVLNKSLSTQLKSPCLITAVQMFIAVVVMLCTTLPQQLKAFEEYPDQLKKWLVVPILFSAMLISSFYTFEYISLSLLTVVRNLAPLVSLPIESILVPSESKPTWSVLVAVLMMLIGAVVYCGGIQDVSTLGLLFAALNCVMCISDRLLQRRLLTTECKGLSLAVCTLVNNFCGLIITLIVAAATGEIQHAGANLDAWQNPRTYALLMLSGLLGIGICYCGLACQREISATSFLVLQSTAKFGVVAMGIVLFADPIESPLVAIGLALSLGGSVLYGKSKLVQQVERK